MRAAAMWSTNADMARATLLYSFVASADAMGLVAFDWKAWRAPAATETTTPPTIPLRESTPAEP